jgi:hypothetical protein
MRVDMHRIVNRKAEEKKMIEAGPSWMRGFFKNHVVYVVGSGPSMGGFDYDSLADKKTIAVNHEILYVPNPSVWCFGDWHTIYNAGVRPMNVLPCRTITFDGTPLNVIDEEYVTRFPRLRDWKKIDDSFAAGCFSRFSSSTFAAHFAIMAGAIGVQLLGIDCGGADGKTHHYTGDGLHPKWGSGKEQHMAEKKAEGYEKQIADWRLLSLRFPGIIKSDGVLGEVLA